MGKYDKKEMQEKLEELRGSFVRMMKDDKDAFERLKDLLHKYRIILPYLSERSKILEERLGLLMTNQDGAKTALATVRQKLRLAQMRLVAEEQTLKGLHQRRTALLSRYNALLEGKMTPAIHDEDVNLSLAEKRHRFMMKLGETFSEMEREVETLDAEIAEASLKKKKLTEKSVRLSRKAEIAGTKLSLYQNDIRDVLLELNNEEMNERKIVEHYRDLVTLIQNAPDIPSWGMKVFAEAVASRHPEGGILQLKAPVSNIIHLH